MDRIMEQDLLRILAQHGLTVTRELAQYRGVDGRNAGHRIYWRRSVRGLPGIIDFSGFPVIDPDVTPIHDNGNVTGQIDCRHVPRARALAIVERAIRQLL